MSNPDIHHIHFLKQAIEVAKQGRYSARPNPCVGAVVVKDGHIVGQGHHHYSGGPHAEVVALEQAQQDTIGATLYVSLEPCNHHGKTPPCVDAILQANIKTCVVASLDPNPFMQGKSLALLSSKGVEIIHIPLKEAEHLNQGFFKRMKYQLPYVRAKIAASIDGQTAMQSGESQWITGRQARADGHLLRAQSGAILTGINTILADNPQLNVRHPIIEQHRHFKHPLKVILDSQLKTPTDANIIHSEGKCLLVVSDRVPSIDIHQWQTQVPSDKVDIVQLPEKQGRCDLLALMRYLAEREINDVMVESGRTLMGALMTEKLIDECHFYLAPKILGEHQMGMFSLPTIHTLTDNIPLAFKAVEKCGDDLKIIATLSSEDI